jgi:hypothetical protein
MNYKILTRRLTFYSQGFGSMTNAEQESQIGQWVRERIVIFSGILREIEQAIPLYYSNYEPKN